jgi:LPS export ABC transporter protein LptC
VVQPVATEKVMTEYSENMSITMSENGRKSYHFETPLIEGYGTAHDPYREFRKGVKITIFDEDTGAESATLTANYAIFYEDRKLWEAKGDVVATNSDGRQLFTSQLFWNQATHKVYSNVDSKIVDGDEVHHCEGFESDEQMKDWTYRKLKGVTYVNDTEFGGEDSSANDSSASNAESAKIKNTQGELKPISRPLRSAPKQNSDSDGPLKPLRNSEQRAMSLELPEKR